MAHVVSSLPVFLHIPPTMTAEDYDACLRQIEWGAARMVESGAGGVLSKWDAANRLFDNMCNLAEMLPKAMKAQALRAIVDAAAMLTAADNLRRSA